MIFLVSLIPSSAEFVSLTMKLSAQYWVDLVGTVGEKGFQVRSKGGITVNDKGNIVVQMQEKADRPVRFITITIAKDQLGKMIKEISDENE